MNNETEGGTLSTLRPTLHTVRHSGAGRLSTMARPRGGDWLDDEMAGLRSAGVGVLVCALTSEELADLDLTEEPRAAREAGLRFVSVPIPDRSVPDLPAVVSTLRELARWFQDGAHVVTHCRFGIGRASLLAAAVLVLNGVEPGEAWRQVEQARGHSVPDTPEQREWPSRLLRWGQGDILAA